MSSDNLPVIAWLVAVLASSGSLYFSEIVHLPACNLCWWQRICMFLLVFAIAAAIKKRNKITAGAVMVLGLAGWLIALYQNLLIWGIIPENIYSCLPGISCKDQVFLLSGFITIPLMSLAAFTAINVGMGLWLKEKVRGPEREKSPPG
jgi:disulfide bond formation protein DsbB